MSDDCTSAAEIQLRIVDVFSDQPDESGGRRGPRGGDGRTTQDFLLSADGTHACLRAERIGDRGEGRTYTLVLGAVDASGRTAMRSVEVHVPRDQREHPECLRSTPAAGPRSPGGGGAAGKVTTQGPGR